MEWRKQFEKSSDSERFPFFEPGHYVAKLRKFALLKGFKGESFVLELEVLEAKDVYKHPNPINGVGSTATVVLKMNDSPDKIQMRLAVLRKFAALALGEKFEDVTLKDLDEWIAEPTLLDGTVVALEAVPITTVGGKPFTKISFQKRIEASPAVAALEAEKGA